MDEREEYFDMYRALGLPFALLAKHAPLIAAALRRQPEFLLPADRERLRTGDL
jgi:hypothetical protein